MKPCPACPADLHRPRTFEAWQVWELAQSLRGQFRAIPGGVVGWDMTAALAMAEALGLNRLIAAELLPLIEPRAEPEPEALPPPEEPEAQPPLDEIARRAT